MLRAKVTSESCYDRGIFLFNTWQQYGDGRIRTRNGLLSEKLCISEMPLVDHLHEVCERAVTKEEMQRITDSMFKIGPSCPAPSYDKNYVCPISVVDETFVDHTVEIEASKSYPGLVTTYHLYTVDIVCSGLPNVDFNSLEFEHEDKDGKRKLKYIHAWVWMKWPTIQRYLFEGSVLKESRTKGSFVDSHELETWLNQFDVNLEAWGTNGLRTVQQLFEEVEREEVLLEHWGRPDGAPLLMRVVHVMQITVCSAENRNDDKFLFHEWTQSRDGWIKHVNRPMSRKLNVSLPMTSSTFKPEAQKAIAEQLTYVVDQHVQLNPHALPKKGDCEVSSIVPVSIEFTNRRFDLEDSPSFRNLTTMYYLYTVVVKCTGLPSSNFATISFDGKRGIEAYGWRWVTWQQVLDMMHAKANQLEARELERSKVLSDLVTKTSDPLKGLKSTIQKLQSKSPHELEIQEELKGIFQALEEDIITPLAKASVVKRATRRTEDLPPSLISHMATRDAFVSGEEEVVSAGRGGHSTPPGGLLFSSCCSAQLRTK